MRKDSNWMAFLVALVIGGCGVDAAAQRESPIEIRMLPDRPSFVTILHRQDPLNRIGQRFQEHLPLVEGPVPRDDREAGINEAQGANLEEGFARGADVRILKLNISEDGWAPQTWTFWLLPVPDGVELLLRVETREFGLNSYFGIQQCFRLSGATNAAWRQEIASTPAFSEFDYWAELEREGKPRASLTYILRGGIWETLPARVETVGARTPLGLRVDRRRTGGDLAAMPRVGPYDAEMLLPIDDGLITRVNRDRTWVCGIYWERSSHVSVHHPADCLHSIVNIGGMPPHSRRLVRGKIYWFPGTLSELARKWQQDFPLHPR
jgi:hypothetical protein